MNPNDTLSHSGVLGMKWKKGVRSDVTFANMTNQELLEYINKTAFMEEVPKASKVAAGKKTVAAILSRKGQTPVPWNKKIF
jgi:hypothetical protein